MKCLPSATEIAWDSKEGSSNMIELAQDVMEGTHNSMKSDNAHAEFEGSDHIIAEIE